MAEVSFQSINREEDSKPIDRENKANGQTFLLLKEIVVDLTNDGFCMPALALISLGKLKQPSIH